MTDSHWGDSLNTYRDVQILHPMSDTQQSVREILSQ